MSIYDIHGNVLNKPYDIAKNELNQAYDIDGNELMPVTSDIVVMTYNYQWCTGRNNLAYQSALYNTYAPDIIGLQEAGSRSTREFPSVAQNALANYPYKYLSNAYNYNGIASKIPLLDVTDNPYTRQDGETYSYQKCYFIFGGKRIAWYNTHLAYREVVTSTRSAQAQELLADAMTEEYAIITGDFNMYGSDFESNEYIGIGKPFADAGFNMANWTEENFVKTWTDATSAESLDDFIYACDNIITSSNIEIANVIFDTSKLTMGSGSIDHIPVVAFLNIK